MSTTVKISDKTHIKLKQMQLNALQEGNSKTLDEVIQELIAIFEKKEMEMTC